MLMHAALNSIGAGAVFPLFKGADAVQMWWLYTRVWIVTAIVIVRRTGPALKGWR
jgi:hypothetical protein